MSLEYTRQFLPIDKDSPYPPILLIEPWPFDLGWTQTNNVGITIISRSITTILNSPRSLQFDLPSNASGGEVTLDKRIFIPPTLKLVLRVAAFAAWNSEISRLRFGFNLASPSNASSAEIQLDFANTRIRYVDSAGVLQNLSSPSLNIRDSTWIFIDIGISFDTQRYLFVRINDLEYDISNISITPGTPGDPATFFFSIIPKAIDNTATSLYLSTLSLREI